MGSSKKNKEYYSDFQSTALLCLLATLALPVIENRIFQRLQQIFLPECAKVRRT